MKSCYTTSQAAKLLAVSSDTVLRWVKAGKIRSYRTPGGHCRIPADAVAALLPGGRGASAAQVRPAPAPGYQYCWEHYGSPRRIGPECRNCIAYLSRTRRCYELRDDPGLFGPLKLFCQKPCTDCEYHRAARCRGQGVLVLSRNRRWLATLTAGSAASGLRLATAASEYECAAAIAGFRPDFIVMDLVLGRRRIRDIHRHLSRDGRLPLIRIIHTSRTPGWAEDCSPEVLGWLRKPFTCGQLREFVSGARRAAGPRGTSPSAPVRPE
jgi:excisionase family DNA binding protein